MKGLEHTYCRCADVDSNKKGTFRDWNPIAADSILKRTIQVHTPCYVVKSERHLYKDASNLQKQDDVNCQNLVCSATNLVGSATKEPPQRPPGIVQEHALHLDNPGLEEEHPVREETRSGPAAGVLAQLAVPEPDADHLDSLRCSGKGQGGGNLRGTADIRGKAPNQKRVVFVDEAYSTEHAVRQKKEHEAREEKLADEGLTREEIKALRKKKKFDQELHFDACGNDLGP